MSDLPEKLMSLCAAGTVDLVRMAPATGDRITAAEVAAACGPYKNRNGNVVSLSDRALLTALHRYARYEGAASQLWAYLLLEAVKLKECENWPDTISRGDDDAMTSVSKQKYVADLCRLAVAEEHYRDRMKTLDFYAKYMRVYEAVWHRSLSPKYEAIRFHLDLWNSDFHRHFLRNWRGTAA